MMNAIKAGKAAYSYQLWALQNLLAHGIET
jgi:hypothetical protein